MGIEDEYGGDDATPNEKKLNGAVMHYGQTPTKGQDALGDDQMLGFCRKCGSDLKDQNPFCADCRLPPASRIGTEGGGPYSPALYAATASLRTSQKTQMGNAERQHKLDTACRLRDRLKGVGIVMKEDTESRIDVVSKWEDREDNTCKKVLAATNSLRAATENIPPAEKAVREAKGVFLKSEERLAEATKKMNEAVASVKRAQKEMDEANENETRCSAQVASAKNSLSAARGYLAMAVNEKNRAERDSDEANWVLNSARNNLRNANNERDQAESAHADARRTQESAKGDEADASRELRYADGERSGAERAANEAERELNNISADSDDYARRQAERKRDQTREKYNDIMSTINQSRRNIERARDDIRDADRVIESTPGRIESANRWISRAKNDVEEARGPAERAEEVLNDAISDLHRAQSDLSSAKYALNQANSNLIAAKNRVARARPILKKAKEERDDARKKKDAAEMEMQASREGLAATQGDMPSEEVRQSARRDLAVAGAGAEAAGRRVDMAEDRVAAAHEKEQVAIRLRDVEGQHQKDEEARWKGEEYDMSALEQAVAEDAGWAAEPLQVAKDLRAAESDLRNARVQYADGILAESKEAVRLAGRWMSEDQKSLEEHEKRLKDAQRWLVPDVLGESPAGGCGAADEGTPSQESPEAHAVRQSGRGGTKWTKTQQEALAAEQKAEEKLVGIMTKWADDRMLWAVELRQDADRRSAFTEERSKDEKNDARQRWEDLMDVVGINNRFGAVLKSLEKVPEPGRTETNIATYRNGVDAAMAYRAAVRAGIKWPGATKHMRAMTYEYYQGMAGMAGKNEKLEASSVCARLRDDGILPAVFREIFEYCPDGRLAIRPWGDVECLKGRLNDISGTTYNQDHDIKFAREHPDVAHITLVGRMNDTEMDALDDAIKKICAASSEISRDGEIGITPTMYRKGMFKEGVLVLTDKHLFLYDGPACENEVERIPLHAITSCGPSGLASLRRPSDVTITYGGDRRVFHLADGFNAGHSVSEECAVWNHMINRCIKRGEETIKTMHIHTEPPGAVVLVDDVPCGITPLVLEKPLSVKSILAKEYNVQMLLEGHKPKKESVSRDGKADSIKCKMSPERRKKEDDQNADGVITKYRQQLPERSATELYFREHALEGKHGTFVLSRDSVIILSADKRVLLAIPYGAIRDMDKPSRLSMEPELCVSYVHDGGLEGKAFFPIDRSKRGECEGIKKRLDEKRQAQSGKESASYLVRVPRRGYVMRAELRLDSVDRHFDGGRELYERGRYEVAIKRYEEVIKMKPDHVDAHYYKGLALYKREMYEAAITCFEEATRMDQTYAFVHYYKGMSLHHLGRYKEAVTCYDEATKWRPEHGHAHYEKGYTLLMLKNYGKAVKCFDEAISLKPDHVDAHYYKGLALYHLERYEAAAKCHSKATSLKPDHVDAHYYKGLALYKREMYEEAAKCLGESIRLKPDHVDAHYYKGLALYHLGRYEEATTRYDAAIRLKPDHVDAHYSKGLALYSRGMYNEAVVCYSVAISQKPDNICPIYINQARAFVKLEKHKEAKKCCKDVEKMRGANEGHKRRAKKIRESIR